MKFTRENLLESIKRLMDLPGAKVLPSIPDDAFLVVTPVEEFDPQTNDLWRLKANKSYPREGIVCIDCQRPVVMSQVAYDAYLKNPDPERVICLKDLLKKS